MPVLSQKEYNKIKQKQEDTHKTVSSVSENKEKQKKLYIFFHPDNPANEYLDDVKYYVSVDNEKKELRIENGCIKTEDERIADILLRKGFVKVREETNGNIRR